jgi:ABC-type Mn2+/Zn2+ transport system ATPase subunit
MLWFAGRPARAGLRLLVLHDDPEREFDYTAGAEHALQEASEQGWTVVSIKHDWTTVFDSL